jgi:hypothetical protein
MSEDRRIIEYFLHEPSLNGTSSWLTWLDCPRKARLNLELRTAGISGVGSPAQQLGTLGHAYVDVYHVGKVGNFSLQFKSWGESGGLNLWHTGEPIDVKLQDEAKRIFKAYTFLRSWDHFGDENESEVSVGDVEESRELATGSAENNWSGRLDLVSKKNGSYIVVDHKFLASSPSSVSIIQYQKSMQIRCYLLALSAVRENVSHGIVNIVVKTKDVKVEEIKVEFPNRRERDEIYSVFRLINKIKRERSDEVNINRCFDYFQLCPHLEYANCNRTGS